MTIPRWTVYPALMVLAGLVFMAIPRRSRLDPYGTDRAAKSVVILGVDGMDPDILREVIDRYPDRMGNFIWLIAQADGIQSLGTSTPPQSPVAWSNFITGLNPGGHGIFDFIHRDLVTREPTPSTTRIEKGHKLSLPGPYKIDIGGSSASNRSGSPFWTLLRERGIPADIWRIPANFPVDPSEGVSFSGMMTPALDSAYGQCTFFTTDKNQKQKLDYDKTRAITLELDGFIDTWISGPINPFIDVGTTSDLVARLSMKIYVDKEAEAILLYAGDRDAGAEKVILKPGEWSDFRRMHFEILPLGLMSMSGICRFYLRSIEPQVELYASAINFDPEDPVVPVSEPSDASSELTESIGRYYTQGMAEDVNALKNGVLDDAEFMQQVTLIHHETMDMLDYALDRFLDNGRRGLLFFYFSEIDLASHMMWRHGDRDHPAHDEALARGPAAAWTGREGSTLAETVEDMYLRLDPALARVRGKLGDDIVLIVMSDHGFAPYNREFSLNTWLVENNYLVLKEGLEKERPRGDPNHQEVHIYYKDKRNQVDWSKTRAYGMGFNGLYLNLKGRERDNPSTEPEDESGIVAPGAEADMLIRELKAGLESVVDSQTGLHPVLRCDIGSDIYTGARTSEAPDLLVGFDSGYGNSDASSTGRIPNELLVDNRPASHGGHLGTFNGNHLMHPDVVPGLLLSNRPLRDGSFRLEDLTVEILRQYGIERPAEMKGSAVFK